LNLTTNANCPVCRKEMEFKWETREIPYFGEALRL
jgi:zinc finger protein